jgi:hypothetical protein
MSDQPNGGGGTVGALFDYLALGFVLAAVDTGVAGKPLVVWVSSFVAGLVCLCGQPGVGQDRGTVGRTRRTHH